MSGAPGHKKTTQEAVDDVVDAAREVWESIVEVLTPFVSWLNRKLGGRA